MMPQKDSKEVNQRYTPDGNPESHFRQNVRDILDLDGFVRDEKIYDELRRLKRGEQIVRPFDGDSR